VLKRKLLNIILKRSREPNITEFNIKKFFKNDDELLSSCYSEYKTRAIMNVASETIREIDGNLAECGVYRAGGTIILANILKEQKSDKHIYAFDSFEGMPEETKLDRMGDGNVFYKKGVLSGTSLEYVNAKAKHYKVKDYITFVKGYFEDSLIKTIKPDQKFCVVVIDPDQYKGTKVCLEFFYEKVLPGGCILIDDYDIEDKERVDTPGVKIAADEFLEDKKEKPNHLADSMYYFKKL
jgi:hypothetical protein